ncbi:MAG: pantoate--beta-alanine ligase [SAR202 cluster bacterium]|nr:pantoate--beta-alanine ligase [SAR202 cluster bacterium]
MQIIESIEDFRKISHKKETKVGLVPTMGALHEGHLSLVRAARRENDIVLVTIFVNPTQFGPEEDFLQYPRNIERDLDLLKKEDVDIVLIPTVDEMYPDGFSTSVNIGKLSEKFEGQFRPGHFNGVATVVTKLLSICRPTVAYFGAKDAQQCAVITKINKELNLGVEISIQPTIRDENGLALSSRNYYLSGSEKSTANLIFHTLDEMSKSWKNGNKNSKILIDQAISTLQSDQSIELNYLAIVDSEHFEEVDTPKYDDLIIIAVKIGSTRLIDNITLT